MEETDVCHPILPGALPQQQSHETCPARLLPPQRRKELAVEALAQTTTVTELARSHQVSRKFVYQQAARADAALDEAFRPEAADDDVLFWLPVTKAWLRQLILALVLICHSPLRGVVELLRDLFDYRLSLGTVHAVVQGAVAQARVHNDRQSLAAVRIGAHDEIFQSRQPVLVGADVASSYCYLLSLEEHRDAETWGVRLLELQDRGFAPAAIVADFGSGLRAGQELALPQTPCRGDVFHALQTLTQEVAFFENRAYQAIDTRSTLERQQADHRRRRGRASLKHSQKLRHARPGEDQAVALAEDVATLTRWLREDVLAVSGLPYADRRALYDFVVAELHARAASYPHRLKPLCTFLDNHRDDLLAFAAELDEDLAALAQEFRVPLHLARRVLDVVRLDPGQARRWPAEAVLRRELGAGFYALSEAVAALAARVVRASSVIENLNSRLRSYFFLRRTLGPDYLALLQFFLNHRHFGRSEHPRRVGKSPAELLTGEAHPHWLELLGYARFSRN
jgi:hypothetical protein